MGVFVPYSGVKRIASMVLDAGLHALIHEHRGSWTGRGSKRTGHFCDPFRIVALATGEPQPDDEEAEG